MDRTSFCEEYAHNGCHGAPLVEVLQLQAMNAEELDGEWEDAAGRPHVQYECPLCGAIRTAETESIFHVRGELPRAPEENDLEFVPLGELDAKHDLQALAAVAADLWYWTTDGGISWYITHLAYQRLFD